MGWGAAALGRAARRLRRRVAQCWRVASYAAQRGPAGRLAPCSTCASAARWKRELRRAGLGTGAVSSGGRGVPRRSLDPRRRRGPRPGACERARGRAGTDAIAVLTGDRRVGLMVDPGSAGRFSLQFTDPTSAWQAANGEGAVRFPACGQAVHRFMGGITFRGQGCVLLWIRPAGHMPIPMLIPIGDTLRGCPAERSRRTLGPGAEPFLGVACHPANSIGCARVGVGVTLKATAALVTVEMTGRFVTLTPPDPPSDLWSGYLYEANLTHGPLDVHLPAGQKLWFVNRRSIRVYGSRCSSPTAESHPGSSRTSSTPASGDSESRTARQKTERSGRLANP